MCEFCSLFGGNEIDNTFRSIVDHHPQCPKLVGIVDVSNVHQKIASLYTNAEKQIAELENALKVLTKYPDLVKDYAQIITRAEKLPGKIFRELSEIKYLNRYFELQWLDIIAVFKKNGVNL